MWHNAWILLEQHTIIQYSFSYKCRVFRWPWSTPPTTVIQLTNSLLSSRHHCKTSCQVPKEGFHSLIPRPLPDFILQPWRKIRTSGTGNGGLGQYVTWTCFVLTESTISTLWRSFDPRPPDFFPRLRDKIWEGRLGTRLGVAWLLHTWDNLTPTKCHHFYLM